MYRGLVKGINAAAWKYVLTPRGGRDGYSHRTVIVRHIQMPPYQDRRWGKRECTSVCLMSAGKRTGGGLCEAGPLLFDTRRWVSEH